MVQVKVNLQQLQLQQHLETLAENVVQPPPQQHQHQETLAEMQMVTVVDAKSFQILVKS